MDNNDDFSGYGGDDYDSDGKISASEQDADDDDINRFTNRTRHSSNSKINLDYVKAFQGAPFAFITIIIGLIVFGVTAVIDLEIGFGVLIALFPSAFIVELIGDKIRKYIKKRKKK
ncbi:hypothetical protein EOM82_06940 [bacterium]|nr:hypothetical protein [bacterium]